MSKFFKDNKIGQVRRESTICSLQKIFKCLLHQIACHYNCTEQMLRPSDQQGTNRLNVDVNVDEDDTFY